MTTLFDNSKTCDCAFSATPHLAPLHFELDSVERSLQEMDGAVVGGDDEFAIGPLGVLVSADQKLQGELFEDVIVDGITEVNDQFDTDFDGTIRAALDGTLRITGKTLDRLQCDVALAYGVRNHTAHNTGSAPAIHERYAEVQQALFRALFATIDYLY